MRTLFARRDGGGSPPETQGSMPARNAHVTTISRRFVGRMETLPSVTGRRPAYVSLSVLAFVHHPLEADGAEKAHLKAIATAAAAPCRPAAGSADASC